MEPTKRYLLGNAPGQGAKTVIISLSISNWTTHKKPAILELNRCCGTSLLLFSEEIGTVPSSSSPRCRTASMQ